MRARRRSGGAGLPLAWSALGDLVGVPLSDVPDRLGEPDGQRHLADEHWLVYRRPEHTLRIRCAGVTSAPPQVASWTVTFAAGALTLRAAVEPLGLWPRAAPDASADAGAGLVRRAIVDPAGSPPLSMTATIRSERFHQVALFDEEPDWMEAPAGR